MSKATSLYLSGLTLAHSVTSDKNFHTSILIGANHYWEFVQDHVVCDNGPTTVQSQFGYLLSGPLPVTQTTSLHISVLSVVWKNNIL